MNGIYHGINQQLLVDKDAVDTQREKARKLLSGMDPLEISVGSIIKNVLEYLDLWEERK